MTVKIKYCFFSIVLCQVRLLSELMHQWNIISVRLILIYCSLCAPKIKNHFHSLFSNWILLSINLHEFSSPDAHTHTHTHKIFNCCICSIWSIHCNAFTARTTLILSWPDISIVLCVYKLFMHLFSLRTNGPDFY